MTAAAIRAGADLETAKQLLETITTVEAIGILKEKGFLEKTMAEILPRIHYYLQHRIGEAFPTEAILFSNEYGFLGETAGAQEMLKHFPKDKEKSVKMKERYDERYFIWCGDRTGRSGTSDFKSSAADPGK